MENKTSEGKKDKKARRKRKEGAQFGKLLATAISPRKRGGPFLGAWLRELRHHAAPSPRPRPPFWRCEISCRAGGRFAGRYRSPWVVASPSAFGLPPSQPRRRREGDNCPETQHLSGLVVQGAREGGPGAAALTPQQPGMRAGARGGRASATRCSRGWRRLPPPGCNPAAAALSSLGMRENRIPTLTVPPARCDVEPLHQLLGPSRLRVLEVKSLPLVVVVRVRNGAGDASNSARHALGTGEWKSR